MKGRKPRYSFRPHPGGCDLGLQENSIGQVMYHYRSRSWLPANGWVWNGDGGLGSKFSGTFGFLHMQTKHRRAQKWHKLTRRDPGRTLSLLLHEANPHT